MISIISKDDLGFAAIVAAAAAAAIATMSAAAQEKAPIDVNYQE
jgi:hypothetical protein